MGLSSNRNAKRALSRQLGRLNRPNFKQTVLVDSKRKLIDSINSDRSINTILNTQAEKDQLIYNFEKEILNKKREKFSPYVETEYVEPEPEFGICDLVDTDFEDDCEYYGNLFLTGQFAILENFETRTNDEIGGEFFNVGLFNYVEDFEDGLSHGELINL